MKRLWNATKNAEAVEELEVADGPLSRMKGLLGRAELPGGRGLLITKCSSIHMFFMKFAIDAVFLDRDMRVMKIAANLAPWQLASCSGARHTLEIPSGASAKAGIEPGDVLRVDQFAS